MDYPEGFPEHLTAPIDTAITDAEIEFAEHRQGRGIQQNLAKYIKTVFTAFCYGASAAVAEGHWTAERARREFREQLRLLTNSTCYAKAPGMFAEAISRIQREVQDELEFSGEWGKIQTALKDAIAQVAERQREKTKAIENLVGTNLKLYRAEAGWSQKELAAMVKLDIRNIQRHESGDTLGIRLEHRRNYESVLSMRLGREIKLDEPHSS